MNEAKGLLQAKDPVDSEKSSDTLLLRTLRSAGLHALSLLAKAK